MFTFLGILFIMAAIVFLVASFFTQKEDKYRTVERFGRMVEELESRASHPLLLFFDIKKSLLMLVVGLMFITLGNSTIFAKEGHQYYVLSPMGERSVIKTPGIKFYFPFSRVQEWSKYIDIMAVHMGKDGKVLDDVTGVEGLIPRGVNVMFIDRAIANVYVSVRFELPSDDQDFIKLVETYRTPENLVNNTLIKTINEQITNVTFMYSADDYVSGAATDYKMTIEDALKNGGFVVEKIEVRDTIYSENLIPGDDIVNKKRSINEIRVLSKNKKVLQNGVPKRIPHEINTNKIITAQVIVSEVKLEDKFMQKLTQQRDISAEKIIEVQKIETARAAQQRIVAEGERDKAQERVAQEKAQVATLIKIETQVKEEESKRQLAQIAVQTAELESKALLIKERAQAESNRMKVSAGLTPQEKAEWEYKTAVGVAAEFAKMETPQVVINGSDKNGGSLTNSLIQAEMAKQLIQKK
jgi:hypothetical protein